MTTETRPSVRIIEEVTSWPGVEAGQGDRGELAFTVGRREIGHLHGDRAAHFGFPKDVWAGAARAGAHRAPPGLPRPRGPRGAHGSRTRPTSSTSSR